MDYLAHSARHGCPPQAYKCHVEGVRALAKQYANAAAAFARKDGLLLNNMVYAAADEHDIGKLDEDNQRTLHKPDGAKHLPVHHQDAGAALLSQQGAPLAAFLVQSHHAGLNNIDDENTDDRPIFRDDDPKTRIRVDCTLPDMVRLHRQLVKPHSLADMEDAQGDLQVLLRMALSCLADADHTNTARHYRRYPAEEESIPLLAKERLARLDAWIAGLGSGDERSLLRHGMYADCRDCVITGGFSSCDSPVGSGKTTAVMAHLLRQAIVRGARRIFVVLPYISIISQSVDVYRKYLTLPGENPEQVVAEVHYRADFEDLNTRCLTALWRAPIVVTTAVAFFETLASNRPASLRRLHELPGSMVFVDECHAAMPVRLLPVAWHWMKVLAEEWSCYWTLASGSLVRFWQLEDFTRDKAAVQELVNPTLRLRLMQYEKQRVTFRWQPAPQSRQDLIAWVQACPGPRLLIVNTVQTAAVLAEDLRRAYGRRRVEHLSTALTAQDREATLERVKARLKDAADDDWTLVATSCVEAGVDFSFRTGFRELASLLSLLQAAGRVNREGLYDDADMWSFSLQDDLMLTRNPRLDASIWVLERFLKSGVTIKPELSTAAIQNELNYDDSANARRNALWELETEGAFRDVAKDFVVIDSDTVTIVTDDTLAEQIRDGQADWQLLQKQGISIPRHKARNYCLEELAPDIYRWNRGYDGFLGYMAGVVANTQAE